MRYLKTDFHPAFFSWSLHIAKETYLFKSLFFPLLFHGVNSFIKKALKTKTPDKKTRSSDIANAARREGSRT